MIVDFQLSQCQFILQTYFNLTYTKKKIVGINALEQ